MIRGWITARFLGLVDGSELQPKNGQISIAMEGNKPDALFPHPLLTEVWEKPDELPAVLESLGLAFTHVNTLNNLEPLTPFIRLRDLGMAEGQPDLFSYKRLSQELRIWVNDGEYPAEAISKPALSLPGEVDDAEQRLKVLLELLRNWEENYDKSFETYKDRVSAAPAALTAPPLFPGLIKLIDLALDQMLEAAVGHKALGVGEFG